MIIAHSKHLDWNLRATQIAEDIVFREDVREEAKQLQCWLDEMDSDITRRCSMGQKIEECDEIKCGDLHIPVTLQAGILEFAAGGVTFRIHKSVDVNDAVQCAETILKLSREDDDIGAMENPIIEMGVKGIQGEKEVAVTEINSGTIRFHKHKNGRLWACAIDEVTKADDGNYRHTTMERIARHEFGHILDINPEIKQIGMDIALRIEQIRACPDEQKRKSAVAELLVIAEALNPHYCPGKVIDWMGKSMLSKNRGVQGRHVLRLQKEDAMLAEELLAEALAGLRGENRQIKETISTPETGLRALIESCRNAKPVAIRWGAHRHPEIVAPEKWFPIGRLAQTPPAFDYKSRTTDTSIGV